MSEIKKKFKLPKEESEDSYNVFSEDEQPKQQQQPKKQESKNKNKNKSSDLQNCVYEDGQYFFDLTSRKKVCVSKFKSQVLVSLREYFEKDGKSLPTKKGLSLNLENWNKLKQFVDEIDECIKKIQ